LQNNTIAWKRDCNTQVVRNLCREGRLQEALVEFKKLPNSFSASALINAYNNSNSRHQSNLDLATEVYRTLIDRSIVPDSYVFSALMSAFQKANQPAKALEVIQKMKDMKVTPDGFCLRLMITIYAETGHIQEAKDLLSSLKYRNIRVNNMDCSQIAQVLSCGCKITEAKTILELMDAKSVHPDRTTYVVLLKSCADHGDLLGGIAVHEHLKTRFGFVCHVTSNFNRNQEESFVAALINMYGKCKNMEKAVGIFSLVKDRECDLFTWTTMMSGYVHVCYYLNILFTISEWPQPKGYRIV
jgi:pentatricopeptide repeat protein